MKLLNEVPLTLRGAYIQAWTQRKFFFDFEFDGLYWWPMDTDSMDSQVDPSWPPWGAGAPFLGQNRANWRANKKWLSWPCYKSKKIFCLGLNWTYEYRKNLILKLLGSGPFSIRQTQKTLFSLGSLKLA